MSTVPEPRDARDVELPPAWLRVVIEGLRINRPDESVVVDAVNVAVALVSAGYRVVKQGSATAHHDGVVTVLGQATARATPTNPVQGLWCDLEPVDR